MWFILQHSPPCGPHTSSIGVAVLGFRACGIEALILIVEKSSTADMTSSSVRYCFPAVFFHVGEQKLVRWCQIRRIWSVINQFKATVTQTKHCNHRLVCRSIVLSILKQGSLLQFSRPFHKIPLVLLFKVLNYLSSVGLSGRKHAVSIRKG